MSIKDLIEIQASQKIEEIKRANKWKPFTREMEIIVHELASLNVASEQKLQVLLQQKFSLREKILFLWQTAVEFRIRRTIDMGTLDKIRKETENQILEMAKVELQEALIYAKKKRLAIRIIELLFIRDKSFFMVLIEFGAIMTAGIKQVLYKCFKYKDTNGI